MQRVHGRDAIFLYMETPTNSFHMVFCGVLDPATVPGAGSDDPRDAFPRLRDLLSARLHLFPPFRQRLVEVPFGLHHPVLVEDPGFDLDFHLRRVALPAPGDTRELETLVADIASRPVDRAHPLWEMYVVEGVAGGRWALVAKAHHAIIDGVGGAEILVNLLDLGPEVREVEPPAEPWTPEPVPGDLQLVGRALAANLASPPRAVRGVARTVGTLLGVARDRVASGDDTIATLGPRTVLNRTRSAHRTVAFGQVPFADVKRVKDAFGVRVNDVVLAVTGRALHRFLEELGDPPDRELVASVPISIRAGAGEGTGNRVAGMTVPLGTHLDDPAAQLRRIDAVAGTAKERLGAITADLLTDWTEFTVPTLAAQAFLFYSGLDLGRRHRPVANITVSNIPGPDVPLHIAGSELEVMYPLGPVVHGQAVNVTVVSYRGTLAVGAIADRDVVSDVRPLVAGVAEALAELVGAAEACAPN